MEGGIFIDWCSKCIYWYIKCKKNSSSDIYDNVLIGVFIKYIIVFSKYVYMNNKLWWFLCLCRYSDWCVYGFVWLKVFSLYVLCFVMSMLICIFLEFGNWLFFKWGCNFNIFWEYKIIVGIYYFIVLLIMIFIWIYILMKC